MASETSPYPPPPPLLCSPPPSPPLSSYPPPPPLLCSSPSPPLSSSYPPPPPLLCSPIPSLSLSPSPAKGKSTAVQNLNAVFNTQKKALLDDIERSIYSYILNTGAQCVAVVQKIPRDTSTTDDPQYSLRKHEMHMDSNMFEFARVLVKFMLNQRHDGFELDSALTEPILGIINDRYINLYTAHDQEISSVLLERLKNDDVLLNSFVRRLTSLLAESVPEVAQEQIAHLIVRRIRDAASSESETSQDIRVGQQMSLLAASAVGTHVAQAAAHAVMRAIAAHIGRIVAKFLASEAFKKILMAMIHQLVMRVITAAVLQVLTVTFGGAIGAGAIMWIIIPIIVGLLAKQIMDFPKKLGKGVSERVKAHLDTKFRVINKTILEETFQKIFNGPGLLKAVAEDEDMKDMFKSLGEKIAGGDW